MNLLQTQIDVLPGAASPHVNLSFQNSTTRNPAQWMKWGFGGGGPSDSGIAVNAQSALRHSPVWQAINILSGDVAQLQFLVQRCDGDRKTHAPRHRVDWTIGEQPNRFQTSDMFYEMMMARALGWGNSVAAIDTSEGDIELRPLPPETTRPDEVSPGNYMITTRINNRELAYMPEETVHLRGLSQGGFWGLSAVDVCKNRLGHGMALLKHGNSTFRNGAKPSGILKSPQGVRMNADSRANLRNEWNAMHSGPDNAGNTAVLWDGMEFQQLSMSNEDAQWAESTELDLLFVAGVFLIPPYKLGYMKDSSVRSNLEAQQREYYNTSLARWVSRFRNEFERKLFTINERRARRYRVAVNIDSLTQGTRKERMETVSLGVRTRLMTRNEGRDDIGLNPVDGGDEFENPAIDTNSDTEGGDSSDDNDAALLNALHKRGVEPLLSAESQQLRRASKNAKNFVEWFDGFCSGYLEFAAEFVNPLAELAVADWQTPIENHLAELKTTVLEIAGQATSETLPARIETYTADASSRADTITKAILEKR